MPQFSSVFDLCRRVWVVAAFLAAVHLNSVGAKAAEKVDVSKLPPSAGHTVEFSSEILPLFKKHCFDCHGPEKQKSSFRLDVKSAALKGGDLGADILPGKSAESPLIHYVSGLVDDMIMPPKGEKLSAADISLLRAWIDQGANWPDGVAEGKIKDKADHWAFKPAARSAVPSSKNILSASNPIDRFILQKLDELGLKPSPQADRRTLIRRLYFNLWGLPPLPEEVDAFVADPDPDAYEKLVTKLLASPRYGERWGRHWLDTVHYGESHGYDKDKPRNNAWPYRDYVIRAFNTDKPYSRFIEEQLAGDVLFPDEPDGVIATGFIAAGPWDFVGHVELPESKTDGLIARYNDRDDMVMTTMSTFQSLTVHCARCHDHKFDPISQREYYRLQAVFAGVDRADRSYDSDSKIFAKRRSLMTEKKALEEKQRELNKVLAKVTSPEIKELDSRLESLKKELVQVAKPKGDSSGNGYHSAIEPMPDVEKWVQIDLGSSRSIDEIRLIPARPTDFTDTPGFGFPRRFRVEISEAADLKDAQVIADHGAADYPNPGDHPVVFAGREGLHGRYVRVTAKRLWERSNDFVFALAEMQVISGTNNLALWAPVSALDSIEAGRWGKTKLVDNQDSRKALGPISEPPERIAKREILDKEKAAMEMQRREQVLAQLEPAVRSDVERGLSRLKVIQQEIESLPKPQWVYAAANDFSPSGNFVPPKGVRPVHLLLRGDVKRPGDLMAPGSLASVPGLEEDLGLSTSVAEGERRAALAKWLTHPDNHLTRRSIVNRVWQYHFGRGIVETANDFGHMGALPSHPELLDWLAFWFQENGESFKQLHKLILTSATYRQASQPHPENENVDADNRYLWRMNRARLDAESIRDSLLQISGKLDLTMGGPSKQQFYFKDDHSPVYDYTRFDVDSPESYRRSIYRFIVRSVPDPFMDCLDSADPSLLTPKRNMTITALQALATLNDPFMVRQAEHVAARLESSASDADGRIHMLYKLALNRAPAAEEKQHLVEYAKKHGLANVCRLVVNSNEFLFID